MNLSPLLGHLANLPAYKQLKRAIIGREPCPATLRLPRAVRGTLAAALASDLGLPVVLLVSRSDRVLSLSEELPSWSPELQPLVFPEPTPLFYEHAPWGPRAIRQRAATLARLTADRQPGGPIQQSLSAPTVVLASARAVMARTLSLHQFLTHSRWLQTGTTC
ncbi:MAG: hypothetical protein PVF70_09815, partial [Anaerolineales bacterium]